jgi:hypothetical protein
MEPRSPSRLRCRVSELEHKGAAMEAGQALIEPRSGGSPQPRVERSGTLGKCKNVVPL